MEGEHGKDAGMCYIIQADACKVGCGAPSLSRSLRPSLGGMP